MVASPKIFLLIFNQYPSVFTQQLFKLSHFQSNIVFNLWESSGICLKNNHVISITATTKLRLSNKITFNLTSFKNLLSSNSLVYFPPVSMVNKSLFMFTNSTCVASPTYCSKTFLPVILFFSCVFNLSFFPKAFFPPSLSTQGIFLILKERNLLWYHIPLSNTSPPHSFGVFIFLSLSHASGH